jgi:hypothetical protein
VYCPKCKTDNAHRSHRHGWTEQLASWFAFYPYRCVQCAHRFLRFRYDSGAELGPAPTMTEREIRSTRAAIRWKGKRREFILYGAGFLLILLFLYFVTRERSPSDGS